MRMRLGTRGSRLALASQVPTDAGEVRIHPDAGDATQPLSARSEWARRTAAEQRYREYWIGHSIAPSPAFPSGVLKGRFDHTGGLVLNDGESSVTLSGGLMITDPGSLELPGVPLAPLVKAAPSDVAVLYLWSSASTRSSASRHSTQSCVAWSTANCFWLRKPSNGRTSTRAPMRSAIARVWSLEPESTTTTSSQNASEARQSPIRASSFQVMTVADSSGRGRGSDGMPGSRSGRGRRRAGGTAVKVTGMLRAEQTSRRRACSR